MKKEETRAMKSQVTEKIERDAWLEADEPARRRKLRSGEKVDLGVFGIPGVHLSGRGTEVFEYPDGTLVPIINQLGPLLRYTFVCLIMESTHTLSKDEVRFVRKHMNLTQDDFGKLLGLTRETISRLESGKERITPATANNIRYCGIRFLVQSSEPKSLRRRASGADISSLIGHFHESVDRAIKQLPKNTKLDLACYS